MSIRTSGAIEGGVVESYRAGLSSSKISKKYQISEATVLSILDRYGIERRPYNTPLNEEEKAIILNLYKSGCELLDIAKQIGRSKSSIVKTIKMAGQFDRASEVDYGLAGKIITDYVGKRLNVDEIADKMSINRTAVYAILRKNNIELDHRIKWVFDYEFFDKDTVETAYWAGFMCADGSLYKGSRVGDNWTLTFALKDTDEDVVRKFCDAICINKDCIHYKKHYLEKYKSTTRLAYVNLIHSNLGPSLRRWGIVPNKTYDYKTPHIPKDLWGPFMVGWIDGDGCLSHRWVGNCFKTTFALVGNRSGMIRFGQMLRLLGYHGRYSIEEKEGNVFSKLSISGTKNALNMANVLSIMKCPFMPRKWAKLLDYGGKSTNF